MITYDVDVYIGRNDPVKAATVKCHDTGVNLRVFLKTEKKTSQWGSEAKAYAIPAGVTPVLKIKKPDEKHVLQDGTHQGSVVFFELPPQSFTVAGTASAEIKLFGADGRQLTSDTFFIEIPKEVADDCAEDSETYVSVMAQQILAAQEAADRAEAAAVNPPKLSDKNTWLVWDPNTGKYNDTGVEATGKAVLYTPQSLTEEQKAQARANIGVGKGGGSVGDEVDPTVPAWAKQPTKPSYSASEVGAYGTAEVDAKINALNADIANAENQTASVKSDVESLQQRINEEAHFKGYLSTNAKIQALEATPNDFAYSAESGTKWVYDAENGWQDTKSPVPDQLTPASDAAPLMNGTASSGTATEYARGDHRHPTDTTRASAAEFNALKADIETALDNIISIQNKLIGGESV